MTRRPSLSPRQRYQARLDRLCSWQEFETDRAPRLRSDINWVIMDYLVLEGYVEAAEKFAQETNLPSPVDAQSIRDRVRIRNAIHAGTVDEAIEMINELEPEVSSFSHSLIRYRKIISKYHAPRRYLFGGDVDANSHFSPQYDWILHSTLQIDSAP